MGDQGDGSWSTVASKGRARRDALPSQDFRQYRTSSGLSSGLYNGTPGRRNSSGSLGSEASSGIPSPVQGLSRCYKTALEDCSQHIHGHRSDKLLRNEFQKIQQKAGANRPYDAGEHADNMDKNRYDDVLPFDFNRVHLHRDDDDPSNWGYINASCIKGKDEDYPTWHYIITQGPLFSTLADFWRTIFEKRCSIIIMLTDFEERTADGKLLPKSDKYLPECPGVVVPFGGIMVELNNEAPLETNGEIMKRELTITSLDHLDALHVTHYHYKRWPDKRVPKSSEAVLELVRILEESGTVYKDGKPEALKNKNYERPGPPVIHCNSGIGRSGAFVAIDIALRRLRHLPKEHDGKEAVDFKNLVIYLRRERLSMVENLEQYRFCYQAAYDAISSGVAV